jgi:molecular chaperone GrpE
MSAENTGAPLEPPTTLDACREALVRAQQEQAALQDKYLRAAAALDNTRKQAERAAAARASARLQQLYRRLLEVADNLERALNFAAPDDALAPGVRATLRQLLDTLASEGVTPIQVAPGVPFDPHFHEAVETRTGDVPVITVAEVQQPGYLFESQVLRPARVVVLRPAVEGRPQDGAGDEHARATTGTEDRRAGGRG